ATRDIWVKLGSWWVSDAGPSGARGFIDAANGSVRQRYHELFSHSDFLYSLNYQKNWIPFLKRGEPLDFDSITPKQLNVRFVTLLTGIFILLILLVWLLFIVRI